MRKRINKKATFGKKALCVLTSAALVASLGFGAAFAAGGSVEGNGEKGAASAVATTGESASAQGIQQRGATQLSEVQVGSEMWIKGGSLIYKSKQDEGYELMLPHKIKVKSIAEEGDTTWYEFGFVDITGAWFLSGYKFVKAEDVSATKPSDSQAGGVTAGTADGKVSLAVSGTPSSAQVQVTSVAPRNAHSDVLEKYVTKGRSLAFAVDISITNDGGEWQPASGKTAVVSLDATKLGLTNGKKIGVLHEHDGVLSELGEYTVADGKLTFETDGFSSFYGYTVDFEYDGTWHSITGGTGIFLSELFSELGISADASQATNVVFSNPTLVEVSKHLNYDPENPVDEWCLRSLSAFDTEELLTVTFADGSVIKINVFDEISSYATWTNGTVVEYGDGYGKSDIGLPGECITISGTCTINVKGSLNIRNQFYIGDGATLKIRSAGGNVTITRDSAMTDDLFVVRGTGKLDIRPHDNDQPGQANAENPDRITINGAKNFTVTDDTASASKTAKTITGPDFNSTAILLQDSATLWMNKVTFKDFFTSGDRAAVIHTRPLNEANKLKNHTTLAMRNCKVEHCATTGGNSVVILADCKASMDTCEITNCASGMNHYAGVLKGNGSFYANLTMTNCTMSGNYSSGWGGALLWAANQSIPNITDAPDSKATITGCKFENNTAKWLGGAISNEAIMEMSNTTISGNKAMSGGGLAVFPYTLTEADPSGVNAVGLTLGKGNEISANKSLADTLTWREDIQGAGKIDYNSGGGGIWVYLNKEKWSAYMEVGEGNTISNNEAVYKGGGVDINTVSSSSTNLKITGATITENEARFGGGVALEESYVSISSGKIDSNIAKENGGGIYMNSADAGNACAVSGEGSVSNNIAANGGGIYLEQGKLDVTGGLIIGNKAVQPAEANFVGQTAKTATSGVGGGIYVKKGSFTLSGDYIGLHSNTADIAAADAYATGGGDTTLTLPNVKAMNLSGWTGTGKPEGWYADYMSPDSYYPETLLGQGNPGRYNYDDPNKLEVKHDLTLKDNERAYYCLTIGTPQGYGELTITKNLVDSKGQPYVTSEDQTFVFEVTPVLAGSSDAADSADAGVAVSSLKVTVVVKAGTSSATATVKQLSYGTYTVAEKSDWSWRYELKSLTVAPQGELAVSGETFTLDGWKPNWTVTAVNEYSNGKWFSGDCYCENWWDGTNGGIVRVPQPPQSPSDDSATMK